VHEEIGSRAFAWQDGYAAFTVSATSRQAVQHYIATQEELITTSPSAKN
jgi:REP element-mobilizing transposase RayT